MGKVRISNEKDLIWVARCKTIDGTEIHKDLSPRFSCVYECLDYIKNNLAVLEFLLNETQKFIDINVDNCLKVRFGSYIRPYHVIQSRFADSFDF